MSSLPSTSSRPNALSYHISTSSNPRSSTTDSSIYSSLSRAYLTRLQHHTNPSLSTLDLISDLSSTAIVPLPTLRRRAIEFPSPSVWSDLITERHLENLCGWPNCSNPPSAPYDARSQESSDSDRSTRFKLRSSGIILTRSRAPTTKEERAMTSYCSKICWRRSEWFAQKGLGRVEAKVRFLEESLEAEQGPSSREPIRKEEDKKDDGLEQKLSSLQIHEKSTPSEEEIVAPRLGHSIDFERPLGRRTTESSLLRTDPRSTTTTTRRRTRPPLPIPTDLPPILPTTRPITSRTTSTRSLAPPPPPLPASGRFEDLSTPLTFSTDPIMVDPRTGQEIEWVDVDEEGESEQVKRWMDEALQIRAQVGRGE